MAREVVGDVQVEWAATLGQDRLDQLLTLLTARLAPGCPVRRQHIGFSAMGTPQAVQI